MGTTAQIAGKGCSGTGINEDLAKRLHDNLGKTIVVVAEISSETRSENRKGDEKVGLVINTLEVAPDGLAAEHVRNLSSALHYERKLAEGTNDQQLPLPGDGPEPKVADVLAAGKAHEPHDYLESGEGEPGTVCDTCSQSSLASIHNVHDPADPDQDGDKNLNNPEE